MKCPCCGNEMELGRLLSPRAYYLEWEKETERIKLAYRKGERIILKSSPLLAYICKECEKIVVDYAGTKYKES